MREKNTKIKRFFISNMKNQYLKHLELVYKRKGYGYKIREVWLLKKGVRIAVFQNNC